MAGTKKTGRPRKGDGPAFPHDEVDRLLVHGEVVESEDGQGTRVHYPSYRQLATRFGVAHSLIAEYAKRHNCLIRRKQAQARAMDMADTKLIELRADALAVSRDDQIRAIDRYLAKFEAAIEDGRVRFDNPADYNTLCRLKAFLLGDADSRHEVTSGMPTLEELQARHAEMLATLNESTPEMRGEVPRWRAGGAGAGRADGGGQGPEGADDHGTVDGGAGESDSQSPENIG